MKSKMFLDPEQPLYTCIENSCAECAVDGTIVCHFKLRQHLFFVLLALPPFILGGWGVWHFGMGWFIGMLAIILSFFGFVEIRVMCSHCPHYAEPGLNSLKCWANYGSPKIWKYRPGPMSKMENIIFFIGMSISFFYPTFFLFLQKYWALGVVHILLVVGFFTTLYQLFCNKCMNFACPLNNVSSEKRNIFFSKNPTVYAAWSVEKEPVNAKNN